MILWDLFYGFLKCSCFTFGGAYGAIPLIRDMVLAYGWIDEEMLTHMIAISESTPGPIMVNLATYIGSDQAGFLGALIATFATVLPAFVVIILVMTILSRVLDNRYVQAALHGLKACVTGVILATGAYMVFNHILAASDGPIDGRALAITAVLFGITYGAKRLGKKKPSPIALIVVSAALGVMLYGIG